MIGPRIGEHVTHGTLMAKKIFHTLNARDNMRLERMRDSLLIGPASMRHVIEDLLAQTERILASKGIQYSDLKSALVPNLKRREIALVFDWLNMQESLYGHRIFRELIPHLLKLSNHSILAGDYVGRNDVQDLLHEFFCESVQQVKNVEWHDSNQFFIVYINNLTDNMISTLPNKLAGFEPFVGFADMTFASRFKLYLSTILLNICIKHKKTVLMGHEDDRDNQEDVNILRYPWSDFGYTCRSLQSQYFDPLLSYKIERPVLLGFESDTGLSINAVSANPLPITDFQVRIDEDKFKHLANEKKGTIKRMGLFESDRSRLRDMISERLSSSYIYNMEHDDQYKITKFNLILEIHPTNGTRPQRVLVSLEYVSAERCLRLITLY